jgi:hypothetical protein
MFAGCPEAAFVFNGGCHDVVFLPKFTIQLIKHLKKLLFLPLLLLTLQLFAQDSTGKNKSDRSVEKRKRTDAIIKQEEEGVLAYRKQSTFGIQLRTNGYGVFYELGRMRTPRFTNLYMIELTEIKDIMEDKVSPVGNGSFNSSFIFGKINYFYQGKLGFGQQYILGQKGNKNGIAVMGIYEGGISIGLLRPYYLTIKESNGNKRNIKYNSPDSTLFFDGPEGSAGLSKGWNEMEMVPGAFIKTALRFDFGKFNEKVQAIQIGLSLEGYSKKIEIMAPSFGGKKIASPKQLFFQGHLAFVFGGRK